MSRTNTVLGSLQVLPRMATKRSHNWKRDSEKQEALGNDEAAMLCADLAALNFQMSRKAKRLLELHERGRYELTS